jgi:ATP-grasp domain
VTARSYFITGARAPVALHLARLLQGAGHRVHLADTLARPLAAASRLHHGYHRLPSLRSDRVGTAAALAERLAALQVDLVIPTCEEVLHLAQIWHDHPMPAALFAPDAELLQDVHDKYRFIQLCQRLGLNAPHTRLLQSRDDVAGLTSHANALVFKPVWSRFATQTLIRPDPEQRARIHPTRKVPWIAQDFVPGDELSVYAVAHTGRVTALSAYRGLVRAGLGASVAFAPVDDPAVTRFVHAFVAGTGWTGQISFDLIRKADGTVLPIECNPRATSGLHFFRDSPAFSQAINGDGVAIPNVTRPQGVRLAIWLYGLPGVFRSKGRHAFLRALSEVEDVMDWPGDKLTLRDQLRPMAEIARLARRHRTSLQAASTRDIEWNGPDQSSIS